MDNVQKIEDSLWEAAEKLRVDSGLKSTQYSTPLLGLVFLRFASIKYDRFKEEIEAEYNRFKGGRNEKRIEDIALQKCGLNLILITCFHYQNQKIFLWLLRRQWKALKNLSLN